MEKEEELVMVPVAATEYSVELAPIPKEII